MGVSILKSGLTVEGSRLGQPVKLTVPRLEEGWGVRLSCVCGGSSYLIGEDQREFLWTPPLSLAAESPNDSWVSVELRLELRQGGVVREQRSFPAAFFVPEELAPALTLTVEDPTHLAARYGGYVQGHSRARVRANARAGLGAQTERIWLGCGCLSGTGETLEFDLPEAGDCPVRARIRDTRGRRAEAETAIAVLPWYPPEGEILGCSPEEDEDGQWLEVRYRCRWAELAGKNTLRCTLEVLQPGETDWTGYPALAEEAVCRIPAPAAGYALRLRVEDDFETAVIPYRPEGAALLDICQENHAIGIGCRGDRTGTVSVGMDLRMEGTRLSGLPSPEAGDEPVNLAFAEGRYWHPRLLWENLSPEEAFSAGTAALTASGFVLVEAAVTAGASERFYTLCAAGVPGRLQCVTGEGAVYRCFEWEDGGMIFQSASAGDIRAVPTRIFAL